MADLGFQSAVDMRTLEGCSLGSLLAHALLLLGHHCLYLLCFLVLLRHLPADSPTIFIPKYLPQKLLLCMF